MSTGGNVPVAGSQGAATWECVRTDLIGALGRDRFDRWFSHTDFNCEADGGVTIGVPNLFIRDWIEQRYLSTVRGAIARHRAVTSVNLRVKGELFRQFRKEEAAFLRTGEPAEAEDEDPERRDSGETLTEAGHASEASRTGGSPGTARRPDARRFSLNERLTLERFVVGSCNRIGFEAARAVLKSPGLAYNPLFFYSDCGLGKTHLAQGLAWQFLRRGERAIRYFPCEEFTNRFIHALRHKDVEGFRRDLYSRKVLLLDDVQVLGKKRQTQEALLDAIEAITSRGGQVILVGDSPPQSMTMLNKQLQGRFIAGLVCRLDPPDYATRVAILRQESAHLGASIPDDILHLVSERFPRNARELIGAFVKVSAFASLMDEPLTVARVDEILNDDVIRERGGVTVDAIVTAVARRFGLSPEEVCSRSRARTLCEARHWIIYCARVLTDHSLSEIGGYLGGRNHATVNSGFRKMAARLQKDPEFEREIEGVIESLKGR